MRNSELEEVILANREDPEPYLVYADWLGAREDPRGELIVLQYQGLMEEAAELIEQHPELVPEIDAGRARLSWRWGFVVGARLDEPSAAEVDFLLAHPSCALLRDLVLDFRSDQARSVIAALARDSRPVIDRLVLHSKPDLMSTSTEPTDQLWNRLPNLRRLAVAGAPMFDGITHAGLRELTIEGNPFAEAASAPWSLPGLEQLAWKLAHDTHDPAAIRALWTAHVPALRRLDLSDYLYYSTYGTDDDPPASLLAQVGFWQLVQQLEVLRVPLRAIGGGSAVATLVAAADRFAHLHELGLAIRSGDRTPPDAARIATALPNLRWI